MRTTAFIFMAISALPAYTMDLPPEQNSDDKAFCIDEAKIILKELPWTTSNTVLTCMSTAVEATGITIAAVGTTYSVRSCSNVGDDDTGASIIVCVGSAFAATFGYGLCMAATIPAWMSYDSFKKRKMACATLEEILNSLNHDDANPDQSILTQISQREDNQEFLASIYQELQKELSRDRNADNQSGICNYIRSCFVRDNKIVNE